MPKKILIIHPEGNINNNPNLTGIVEILCENGFAVHIFSPKCEGIYQATPCKGSQLFIVPKHGNPILHGYTLLAGKPAGWMPKMISNMSQKLGPYHLIIGIDRGVIEASVIAKLLKVPCGLISYEILFRDETSLEFKKPEIDACRTISFAVCQDAQRGTLLAEENQIAPGKIICIPFAGRFLRKPLKNKYLHEQLGIHKSKRLALMIGSVSEMSMASYLIESAQFWPDEWALVLHNRYGLNPQTQRYLQKYKGRPNLYFSLNPETNPNKLHKILYSADLGIGLYKSYSNSIWLGKNISNLGMASGKIATYLQHGLPVVVNEIGEYSECVRNHKLGIVIDDRQPFKMLPTSCDLERWMSNCCAFFSRCLDLNQTIGPFLQYVFQICHTPLRQNLFASNF